MKTKLIITESQYNRLIKPIINESAVAMVLEDIIEYLDKNYDKVTATVRDYYDYVNKPRFKVLADDSVITAKQVLDYFKNKYFDRCGEDFLKQAIEDWYYNKIKDGLLSKNITLW